MTILQIIYILAAFIALSAGLPQMKKLVRTRSSKDFHLNTWIMWIGTQLVATVYAVSLKDALLVGINTAWLLFYITMVILIIRYQHALVTVEELENL